MESLKHFKRFKFLFFVEMWECFSFYGLSTLTLYITQRLCFTNANSTLIFGSYVTFLYINSNYNNS
ncbi:hypothetical protein CDV26_06715 [Francisella halioticida]|uniref:MFS transporter n=1 Tax=Francisella halioticida TaxID=549298 RepID=A0ABM6LZJ1_9GAMM|nr:hypothetical protein CDV26_06715 [Francisella halioticida]